MTNLLKILIKKRFDSFFAYVKCVIGFAYVGGACVVNKRLEKVNSVAIIEDTGGFSGIIVAAHEVGHLYVSEHFFPQIFFHFSKTVFFSNKFKFLQ